MTLRWIAVAVTFLALLAAVAFGWRTQGLEGASWIFGIVGGLVALVMATAPLLRRDKQDLLPDESKVDTTHRRVAAHIARSIGSEAGTRRVDERLRIPLRLSVVSPPASDHWSNVTGPASERLDILLRGNLDISETFARAPTGRLVILGEPGSGKSTLLRTLAEDLLRRIRDTPPGSIAPRLPVLLDLRTWDPEATSFRDWFLDESVRAYPILATEDPGTGVRRSVLLLDEGRVLPLLDNLDQMSPGAAAAALSRLPGDPLVLGSQDGFYLKVTRRWRTLPGAVVMKVGQPEPRSVFTYLRLAGPTDDRGRSIWEPTIAILTSASGRKRFGPLIRTLRVPLFAYLAALTHADPASDPARLTELTERSVADIQGRLAETAFDTFVASRRDPVRAREWLKRTAGLTVDNGGSLAWWALRKEVPRWFHWLVNFLVVGALAGATLVAVAYLSHIPAGPAFVPTVLQFGFLVTLLSRFRPRTAPGPRRLHLRLRGRYRTAAVSLAVGILGGLSMAFILADAAGLWPASLIGASIAISTTVVPLVSRDVDIDYVSSPRHGLRFERDLALFQGTAIGVVSGSFVGLRYGFFGGIPVSGIEAGLAQGLIGGVGMFFASVLCAVFVLSVWGDWIKFRIFAGLTGRVPWRFLPFLEAACSYGILRQSGATYEFRHRLMRDRLLTG